MLGSGAPVIEFQWCPWTSVSRRVRFCTFLSIAMCISLHVCSCLRVRALDKKKERSYQIPESVSRSFTPYSVIYIVFVFFINTLIFI